MERSRSFIATPPGATIKEQLVERGMSQKEFAVRMGMSQKHISKLINGEVHLTIEVARRLEMVLGVPTQFWCNLESVYREKLAKTQEENAMDADIEVTKKMPYSEMVRLGWIEDSREWSEKVIILRKFFEVAQLSYLNGDLIPEIVYSRVSYIEESIFSLIAWTQEAKLEARKIVTKFIDIDMLTKQIPVVREMVTKNLQEVYNELSEILANCGIAFILLPTIDVLNLRGATFKDGNKIVVVLNSKEQMPEELWFALFHELAHIILGHIMKTEVLTEEDETNADTYARNILRVRYANE